MISEMQIHVIARQMFEKHGAEAIYQAAQNAIACENKGDTEEALSARIKAGDQVCGQQVADIGDDPVVTTFNRLILPQAIKAAAGKGRTVELLIKAGDLYRTVSLDWHGGLRYPRLEKVGKGEGTLDALLAPR